MIAVDGFGQGWIADASACKRIANSESESIILWPLIGDIRKLCEINDL